MSLNNTLTECVLATGSTDGRTTAQITGGYLNFSAEGDVPVRALAAAVIAQAVLDLQRPELSVRRDARKFLHSGGVEEWLTVLQLNGQCRKVRETLQGLAEDGFRDEQRLALTRCTSPW